MRAPASPSSALPESRRLDLGESLRGAAANDSFETSERFSIEQGRVYAVKLRQISGELLQPLAELALSAGRVRLLLMIKADGEMNHPLQEQPPWTTHGPPQVFEDFMALEKRLLVEELDALSKQIAGSFHFTGFTFVRARETNRGSIAAPAQR